MENKKKGIIIKGINGFYYVESDKTIYVCKARGVFRKKRITPLAGDKVLITIRDNSEHTIDEILPRKNYFLRPPVANIDKLIIMASVADPFPNLYNIDLLTVLAINCGVQPIVVFSKSDLCDSEAYTNIYKKAKIPCCSISCTCNTGIDILLNEIKNSISVLTGNTGVGKSSFINAVFPDAKAPVGEISKKLGRGRHTTRECVLYPLADGYLADTAGFSSLDLCSNNISFSCNDLDVLFPEFAPFLGKCKYSTCSHVSEDGCAIISAIDSDAISSSRHKSYCRMYAEIKANHSKYRNKKIKKTNSLFHL